MESIGYRQGLFKGQNDSEVIGYDLGFTVALRLSFVLHKILENETDSQYLILLDGHLWKDMDLKFLGNIDVTEWKREGSLNAEFIQELCTIQPLFRELVKKQREL